ncbi:hypothetical protein CROQUDRAFT_669100 [Cronartium quercuum f. sp. fusiforme G11]|uniref:Uncharacterized protein n=1 Tax=Cronartium quercuum f. sp. fusiforme G11 TaxID=708437 RepID=A0A9P6NSQ0_9BASI|nr:hypothetical protein CROQUDRAFT_669100 [Cronartium quercuum f. sp. fusiforme G11]
MKSQLQGYFGTRTRTRCLVILLTSFLQVTISNPIARRDYHNTGKDYTSLVIFGDSYSAPPAVGGRYCNGPVWDEFLSISLSSPTKPVSRLNYAYNGAHINNRLTNNSVPDTSTQISDYLDELEASQRTEDPYAIAESRALHIIWIGINPLVYMWRDTELIDSKPDTLNKAFIDVSKRIDRQIVELSRQVNELVKNPHVNRLSPQFIVLTPPLLHTTQLVRIESRRRSGDDDRLTNSYIELMKEMRSYFGQTLFESIILKAQSINTKRRKLTVFDTVKFWNEVQNKPSQYGIISTEACLSDINQPPCKDPGHFEYWDQLHTTTAFHSEFSLILHQFVQELKDD